VATLVSEVKATPLAQGFDKIFYPGELEDRTAERTLQEGGIVLPEQTIVDLQRVAAEQGVPAPF
jgi:LDH2 family malate/lactate/ureidoglycolate dehydrogenase